MLNNRGFAVSTMLYTLLIAFLLFLGVMLASFSSSNSIISNANNDLINGTKLSIVQVKDAEIKDAEKKGTCVSLGTTKTGNNYYWYEIDSGILAKINSRYGVMYWPRDFKEKIDNNTITYESINNNIEISDDSEGAYKDGGTINVNNSNTFELKVEDKNTGEEASVIMGDICG